MLHLSIPLWFDHPNKIWRGLKIMKPAITQFSAASRVFQNNTKLDKQEGTRKSTGIYGLNNKFFLTSSLFCGVT